MPVHALCPESRRRRRPASTRGPTRSSRRKATRRRRRSWPTPSWRRATSTSRSPAPAPTRSGSSTRSATAPSSMKTFSKPFHELGGVFIDYKANRARALTIRNNVGIQLISATDGSKKPIQVPAGARVSNATWSPDGKAIAFFVHGEDATHIYVADVATGKSRQLTQDAGARDAGDQLRVHRRRQADRRRASCRTAAPPMPPPPAAPTGPTVKLADTDKNRLRTFPSLMSTPYEKELLEVARDRPDRAHRRRRRARSARSASRTMIRSIDFAPDAQVRARDADGQAVLLRRAGQQLRLDRRESGTPTARCSRRSPSAPINLGVQDDTQPQTPPDPAAAPGGGRGGSQNQTRQARARVARRRPGLDLPRAGAGAGDAGAAVRAAARPAAPTDAGGQPPAAADAARAAGRGTQAHAQGPPLSVAAAVRRRRARR